MRALVGVMLPLFGAHVYACSISTTWGITLTAVFHFPIYILRGKKFQIIGLPPWPMIMQFIIVSNR